jgi:beta-glucosidase
VARVEPEPGRYNEAAIRRYVEMARKLKAAGIEPVVTLAFHIPELDGDERERGQIALAASSLP